jgi:uncharacterized protein
MSGVLVGRRQEQAALQEALNAADAELVAVYGRRRVGKTFLIRHFFGEQIVFELTGSHAADMATQLQAFAVALGRAMRTAAPLAPATDWIEAFRQLETYLRALPRPRRHQKHVVFLDELPWLATRRSGFLTAFEHFWNAWASAQPWLVVVICGSAASWMLRRVVRQRGGLHNRVTRRIRLDPFLLPDTEAFLEARNVRLDRYQILELYMAFGGVPHYLNQARAGRSAAQTIDAACFAADGPLRDEFSQLYAALFERSERHEAIVRALATKRSGLDRNELLAAADLPSGGTATKVLDELEESGFVARRVPLGHALRDSRYYLADEYSLFFLIWIQKQRGGMDASWLTKRAGPRFRSWSGLAFERVCMKHVGAIKRDLGIGAVETEQGVWVHRSAAPDDEGAQVDLVIDRADRSVNLCEMKFSESTFVVDKACARELARKRDVFTRFAGANKSVFITLVTTQGVRPNEHAQRLGIQVVTMDALFR